MRHAMRLLLTSIVLLTICYPSVGQPESVDPQRNAPESQEARWAELEAQRRATDGDYDGAVQAHQRAEQASQDARSQQMSEQSDR
jgi:hypothetical protein